MAVKASATITISCYRDTSSITRYYKLQSSTLATPSKPTTNPPSGWDDAEPSYTSGSTNTLYFCDLMVFSDGTFQYTKVSKSSSYEAAKEAYNLAHSVGTDLDNLEIGGRNLYPNSKGPFTVAPKNTGAAGDNYNYYTFNVDMELNEVYTISADIEITDGTFDAVTVYPYPKGASRLVSIPENSRISYTFIKSNEETIKVLIYAGAAGSTRGNGIIIRNVKIEQGNRATNWTPDPDDMATKTETAEAAKTATNFLELTDANGLVVGNLTDGTLKGNVQLKAETGGASISLRDGTTSLAKFSAISKAFTGVTSATTSTSSTTQSEVGEGGTASETITSASQTVSNNQTKNVVKIESSQPVYFSQGIRTNGVTVNDDSLISNVDFTMNGRLFDKNGKSFIEPYTSEGNLSIGYGRFKDATSTSTDWTILYGNKAKIATKNGFVATQNGSTTLETLNSNGNATFGYHLYKAGTGDLNLYGGDAINLKAKTASIIDSTGSSCFEAKNSNGNTVIGYARYANSGNTNIYAGSELNLITNNGNIRAKSSIIPDTNASIALGKYNELGWSNIYIGNASGVYNGLRVIVDGSSKNLCGRDGDGHVIFGNIDSVMHYQAKNVSASNTGNAFRFTSGNNDAKNNSTSIWLFGAADSTSRYIGSYMAYDRTYSSAANMVVTANGVFGRSTSSSKRYKEDIKIADISDLNGLYNLPVKKFKYCSDYISENDELYGKHLYGFVVEDLDDILPCAVQHIEAEDGTMLPEMWNSNVIVPALLKLIQDLNERVSVLEKEVMLHK